MEKFKDTEVFQSKSISDAVRKMQPGTYCVMDRYFHQYAEGITGISEGFNYYFPEGGFKKRPAQQFKNNELEKEKHIKGAKSRGYGSVGTEMYEKKILSYEELTRAKEGSYCYWDKRAFFGW